MNERLEAMLWSPHYWGRIGNEAVMILQVPSYQFLIDLQAISGYVPSVPHLVETFNRNVGETRHHLGWIYFGDVDSVPEEAELVWTANFGDEMVLIGKGKAPVGAMPYVYRLLDGVNYE